jgi:hypothetical protein
MAEPLHEESLRLLLAYFVGEPIFIVWHRMLAQCRDELFEGISCAFPNVKAQISGSSRRSP